MGNTLNNKKANGLALLPFLVFIVIYMGAGLVYQSKGVDMAFYQFPSVTAMFLAVLVAFIMFKGSINEKFDTFAKGAANVDVLTMLIIYILAGAFATVAAEMGGRDATVNLGLSLVPVQFLAAGLFVIGCFHGYRYRYFHGHHLRHHSHRCRRCGKGWLEYDGRSGRSYRRRYVRR